MVARRSNFKLKLDDYSKRNVTAWCQYNSTSATWSTLASLRTNPTAIKYFHNITDHSLNIDSFEFDDGARYFAWEPNDSVRFKTIAIENKVKCTAQSTFDTTIGISSRVLLLKPNQSVDLSCSVNVKGNMSDMDLGDFRIFWYVTYFYNDRSAIMVRRLFLNNSSTGVHAEWTTATTVRIQQNLTYTFPSDPSTAWQFHKQQIYCQVGHRNLYVQELQQFVAINEIEGLSCLFDLALALIPFVNRNVTLVKYTKPNERAAIECPIKVTSGQYGIEWHHRTNYQANWYRLISNKPYENPNEYFEIHVRKPINQFKCRVYVLNGNTTASMLEMVSVVEVKYNDTENVDNSRTSLFAILVLASMVSGVLNVTLLCLIKNEHVKTKEYNRKPRQAHNSSDMMPLNDLVSNQANVQIITTDLSV
jgi:hypothetical protein